MIKVVHLCDQHFPFQSKGAIRRSLAVVREIAPDIVVLGGDVVDCHAISRYRIRQDRFNSLQREFSTALNYLEQLVLAAPSRAQFHLTLGNHEERVAKYLDRNAPGLATLKDLTVEHLLKCDDLGIKVHEYGDGVTFGDLYFTHGSIVRKWGGSSVRGMLESCGCSVAMGHSHRLASVSVRQGPRIITGYESGCLCVPKQHYMLHTPDAQEGMSIFTFEGTKTPEGSPLWTPVPLHTARAASLAVSLHTE